MGWVGVAAALALIVVVFIDAFEAMILPRRVRHGYRPARLFYRSAWVLWRGAGRVFPARQWGPGFFFVFVPLFFFSMLTLLAAGPLPRVSPLPLSLSTPRAL